MESGNIAVVIAAFSTAFAAYTQYRSSVLKTALSKTQAATQGELNQIGQVLQSWKDITAEYGKKVDSCEQCCEELRTDLTVEQEKRHQCEINLAELKGKMEVLIQQDARNNDRMNRQDARSTTRQQQVDERQDLSDHRQDLNDANQNARHNLQDVRQNVQDDKLLVTDAEILRLADEVKAVEQESHNT